MKLNQADYWSNNENLQKPSRGSKKVISSVPFFKSDQNRFLFCLRVKNKWSRVFFLKSLMFKQMKVHFVEFVVVILVSATRG